MAEGQDQERLSLVGPTQAQLGVIGESKCHPHPGRPVGKVLGVLLEGLAELLVGGLDVAGQLLGRVPQCSQAQLLLQSLMGTAAGSAGVSWER